MDTKTKEFAIKRTQQKYGPSEVNKINSIIRTLANNHYKYGSHMPLVYGKARGIREILNVFYNIDVSIQYVWTIIEDYINEPEE